MTAPYLTPAQRAVLATAARAGSSGATTAWVSHYSGDTTRTAHALRHLAHLGLVTDVRPEHATSPLWTATEAGHAVLAAGRLP